MKGHCVTMWLRLTLKYSVPTSIVTITVENGVTFHVHKDVLTLDCAYFDKALNGPFLEAQSQSINLDDISSESFGLYVDILYKFTADFRNLDMLKGRLGSNNGYSWRELLEIWKLSDRFLNPKLMGVARQILEYRLRCISWSVWKYHYQFADWEKIKGLAGNLQEGFRFCKTADLPFKDEFVTALMSCPPQVFAQIVADLDDDFKTAATQRFAMRFADPSVTAARKRVVGEDEGENGPAKKQKED